MYPAPEIPVETLVPAPPFVDETRTAKVIDAASGERHPNDDHEVTISESSIVAVIDLLYNRARNDRRWRRLAEWELNRAFFRDRAWAIWDPGKHAIELDPPRSNPNAKRLQVNLYKSFVITAAARIAATHPVILVHAGSRDQENIDNARVAQRCLEYEWNRQRMPLRISRTVIPHMLDGSSVWSVEWDPKGGRVIGQATDMQTRQEVNVHEGNIVTRRLRCHHFFMDPTAREYEDAMWCMEAVPRATAWIYRQYGVAVQPDGQGYLDEDGGTASDFSHGEITRLETATVKKWWLRPGPLRYGSTPDEVVNLPRGMTVTVAGGRILEGPVDNPYAEHESFLPGPYVFIPCLPIDSEPWGETIFNSLRSPQVSLNKTWSQIVESNDFMANPVWQVPIECQVMGSDWSSAPGSILWFDGSGSQFEPKRVDGKGAAPSVFKAVDLMLRAFQMISGIHEGGLGGGAPKNVESGVGLEVLTERDTSRLAITALELGRGIQRWGEMCLFLIKSFWQEDRLFTVTGPQLEAEAFVFSGAKIGDAFEVRVVAESVMPQSRTAKLNEVLVKLSAQLITPTDARRLLATEETGELNREQMEVNLARNENLQAEMQGQIATPIEQMALENHALHIDEHMKALLRPQNQPGMQGVPKAWLALYAHVQAHQQLLWQEFLNQQAMQTPTGAPGGEEEGAAPEQEQKPEESSQPVGAGSPAAGPPA